MFLEEIIHWELSERANQWISRFRKITFLVQRQQTGKVDFS